MGYLLLFIFGLGAVLQFFKRFWKPITAAVAVPLGALGNLLAPVTGKLPDSIWVPVIAAVVLFVIWFLSVGLGGERGPLSGDSAESMLHLLYAWVWTAFSLGMIVAISGNPLCKWSMFMSTLFGHDFPLTLMNFAEWEGFAQVMLLLTLVGGLFAAVFFAIFQGFSCFVFVLTTIGIGGLLGYLFMYGQLALLDILGSIVGAFIPGLLSAGLTLVNGLIMIQFFIGLVLFCMSREAISDCAKASLERERKAIYSHRTSSSSSSDDSDFFDFLESSDVPVPVYVTDEDGNHYPVEKRGDFIFIRAKVGEISTKWEYVRGQPSFDLHGKTYYPH